MWGLLLSMRIVYSKETIRESMLQVGRRIMELGWNGTSSSLGFCVSDNYAYTNKLTYQHAEKDGHFFETVNYFYFPLHLLVSLLLSAVWDRGVSRALGGGRVGDVIGRHPPRVPLQALSLIAGGEGPSRRRGGE